MRRMPLCDAIIDTQISNQLSPIGIPGRCMIYVHMFTIAIAMILGRKIFTETLIPPWVTGAGLSVYIIILYKLGDLKPGSYNAVEYVITMSTFVQVWALCETRKSWRQVSAIFLFLSSTISATTLFILYVQVWGDIINQQCDSYFFFLAKVRVSQGWRIAMIVTVVITIVKFTALASYNYVYCNIAYSFMDYSRF